MLSRKFAGLILVTYDLNPEMFRIPKTWEHYYLEDDRKNYDEQYVGGHLTLHLSINQFCTS
jgi:hypothetical protein